MSRRVDWAAREEQAKHQLREGESLRALLPALSPRPPAGSGLVPASFIPLIHVVDRWQWRRVTRRRMTESRFPLAPRMVLGVTDRRLLIWKSDRRWRLSDFIGYVTLDRVVLAEAPTIGAGWRSVRVDLANEPSVVIKVPAPAADGLAMVLSRGLDDPM